MIGYRAYILGPSGDFIRAHEIAADDHNQAVIAAIRLMKDRDVELWCGDVFVGTLKPSPAGKAPTFKRPSRTTKAQAR
jgi:hypothetical protein